MSNSYRDLDVWNLGVELVTQIYRLTDDFPQNERYGLVSQLRRAAVSVPSNITEGQGRLTGGEFRHCLSIARGSLMEIETQLLISVNLGFVQRSKIEEFLDHCDRIRRMLYPLVLSISDGPIPGNS